MKEMRFLKRQKKTRSPVWAMLHHNIVNYLKQLFSWSDLDFTTTLITKIIFRKGGKMTK